MRLVELSHHFGWVPYNVLTAYDAVRLSHPFLTDENHIWEDNGGRVVIRKNDASPPFSFAPAWVSDGPGALWFSVAYRFQQEAT